MSLQLPKSLALLFMEGNAPEAVIEGLLPAICEVLQSDRCFFHLRQPDRRLHRVLCWRRNPDVPDVSTVGWEPEMEWEREDPMFAAALRAAPSIFVEDVETAGPEILNREFERQSFGHRALIHAHVCQDGKLWGILQPCLFGQPRVWSESDRAIVIEVVERVRPFAIGYVEEAMRAIDE